MILLVSDDSRTRERLRSALPGRPLEQVPNVAALDESPPDSRPDVVVVDVPDATDARADLPARIRETFEPPAIPVVALVSDMDGPSWGTYDGVIERPVDPARAKAVIETAERFAEYDDAIGTLFELCQRRADDEVPCEEIRAAREEADARLTALRASSDGFPFERLVREE